MQWQDLSFERAEWRIPQTKSDRPHLLPLPQPLVSLLRQLPRMDGGPYVLPGRDGHGHLVNVKRAWERIRTHAALPDVRIHDLRRTVGSWLAGGGESLALIPGEIVLWWTRGAGHQECDNSEICLHCDWPPILDGTMDGPRINHSRLRQNSLIWPCHRPKHPGPGIPTTVLSF